MTDETNAPGQPGAEEMPEIDLAQIRVEVLILQVASELMSIGAGQLGMVPGMVNGGDAVQASLAIGAADAMVESFAQGLPEGVPVPPQVEELRRAVAELKLAFAEAVRPADGPVGSEGGEGAPTAEPQQPRSPIQEPPRPSIWTPGGEV